jgi:hypothetical protein
VNEAKEGCRNVKISSLSCVVRSSIRAPVAALPDRYGHGVKKGLSVPGSGITSPPRVSDADQSAMSQSGETAAIRIGLLDVIACCAR